MLVQMIARFKKKFKKYFSITDLQKVVNTQFLLQNKSQVLGADLVTAAPAAGSQACSSSLGRPSRSRGPAAQKRDGGAPPSPLCHPALVPQPHPCVNLQTTKHNCRDSNREMLLDSRA